MVHSLFAQNKGDDTSRLSAVTKNAGMESIIIIIIIIITSII